MKKIKKRRLQRIITLFLWNNFRKPSDYKLELPKWVEKHPKAIPACCIGLCMIYAICDHLQPIVNMRQVTEDDILKIKRSQNQSPNDLTQKGMKLKIGLDSLIHLSKKTKENSLLIYNRHKQLSPEDFKK